MTESSHDRRTRGRQIRTPRKQKENKRGKKELEDRDDASPNLRDGSELAPDPFVETEAVSDVRERVGHWLSVDRPVHLVGPTGCGKTALALHVAAERDRPVVLVNGDASLGTADLVGEYGERERYSVRDEFVRDVVKRTDIERDRWVDNALTTAVREGATLVYNEFSRTKPAANNVFLSMFEEGVLELPGKRGEDRSVDVHPEFRAIFTSNDAEYAGVHEPQDALLDRLVGVYLDYYDAETEREIVTARVEEADADQVETVVDAVRAVRAQLDVTVGTRAAVMAAEAVAALERGDESADDDAVVQCCVDAMASKTATRGEIEPLRETVQEVT